MVDSIKLQTKSAMKLKYAKESEEYNALEENDYYEELPDFDFEEVLSNDSIVAHLQGKIYDVKVKIGDKVKTNSILAILETMKMEIDILSTCDGVIQSSHIKVGDFVKKDEELFVIARSD